MKHMTRRSKSRFLITAALALLSGIAAAGCERSLTADIKKPESDILLFVGEALRFEGSVWGGEDPYSFSWNFGGAAPDSTAEDPGDVIFGVEGAYTVVFTAADKNGDTDSDSVVVTVVTTQYRTKEQIKAYWNNIKPSLASPAYGSAPVLSVGNDGYEGQLSQQLIDEGIAWVNFYRWLAGLPDDVAEDPVFRVRTQKGAHVLVMLDILNDPVPSPHDPPLPTGASVWYESDIYGGPRNTGANTGGWLSCASSNVFWGWGTAYTPVQTVDGYMDDYGNDTTLGHRRWILYPRFTKTAFGTVWGSGVWASNMYVLERPGFTAPTPDFDFVAYPSPGFYPVQCFTGPSALWSFSANSAKYDLDTNTFATVVRQSDLQSITVTTQIKTAGYGITPTISFNPGESTKDETYSVTIHGVWDKTGLARIDYSYTVTFFDLTE